MAVSAENKMVAKHAAAAFGGRPNVWDYHHDTEPLTIGVLKSADRPTRGVTAYATIGVSDTPLLREDGSPFDGRMEIAGVCATKDEAFGNVLAAAAFCIIRTRRVYPPGSAMKNYVAEYFPDSSVPHLYFTAPFLWEDALTTLDCGTKRVSWVLAMPISNGERDYLEKHGDDALESLFESEQIDIFDLGRASVQ
jgi:hypothetical protein